MPEQLLDDPQVRSALEQMRGERVPQGVRADAFGDAGTVRCALDGRPHLLPRQAATAIAEEQGPAAP